MTGPITRGWMIKGPRNCFYFNRLLARRHLPCWPRVCMDSDSVDAQIPNDFSLHHRGLSSPIFPTSINHIHISEALLKSEDSGATLDFSHKGLTDVGEYGAEQLATIGREDSMEDESSVLRCALPSLPCHQLCTDPFPHFSNS
jgi:hypothetical protein